MKTDHGSWKSVFSVAAPFGCSGDFGAERTHVQQKWTPLGDVLAEEAEIPAARDTTERHRERGCNGASKYTYSYPPAHLLVVGMLRFLSMT